MISFFCSSMSLLLWTQLLMCCLNVHLDYNSDVKADTSVASLPVWPYRQSILHVWQNSTAETKFIWNLHANGLYVVIILRLRAIVMSSKNGNKLVSKSLSVFNWLSSKCLKLGLWFQEACNIHMLCFTTQNTPLIVPQLNYKERKRN